MDTVVAETNAFYQPKLYARSFSQGRKPNSTVQSEPDPGLSHLQEVSMSEESQMDTLAYSSRMLHWAPLGKLLFAVGLLIVNILTPSILVSIVIFIIGLVMLAYSTNFKVPFIIALFIAEAVFIAIIGAGVISILGDQFDPAIWDTHILWLTVHMTEASFNEAWLILFRCVAGIGVMLAFATSTPIPHLSQALRQLRIPAEVSELVVLIYRYGFLLLERMEIMWSAASSRMGFNGFRRSINSVASIAVGMFISSFGMADKAQIALDCRNYRGYFPVYNMPPKAGIKWVAVTAVAVVVLYIFGTETAGMVDMATILGVHA